MPGETKEDKSDGTGGFRSGYFFSQVEGWFGNLKQDYGYRRIRRRGKENVLKELLLIGMGANVRKLHNRIQSGRIGITRFELKEA